MNISFITLAIILIIMYLCIFQLELILNQKNIDKVHNFSEKCLVGCSGRESTCDCLNSYRDNGYYLFESDNNKVRCAITRWELSHIIFHIFLGYFTNIYISQGLSVGFEIYEHYFYDCGSYLDLMYNFMGFLVGHSLRYCL